jgi:hypothetical protein
MIRWLRRRMACMRRGDRTRIPERSDWRGHPIGDNREAAMSLVRLEEEDRFATLDPAVVTTGSSTTTARVTSSRDG